MGKLNDYDRNSIAYQNQKIVDVPMGKRVQTSFIEYAMSVIVSRALPDVRDGLKPVHRRILYAMYEDKLTYDRPFCKSAATVGNVLGRYHPHGDSSVYDALVRLAQSFSMRYPLIDGHGNFGNVDGDGAAHYRYTEARMSKIANEMLSDIDKNVVDFTPNFDNRMKEPVVLPSRFPNLLVNGSVGIAVGMATNVPPHNLGEVIDGTIYFMEHPDASVIDLMQYIKGPDFPTRAIICGTNGIYKAYSTGHGRIIVRAKAEVNEEDRTIIVTEIPYMVNKAMLVKSIANLVKDKKVDGITALRDESGKAGMRIVIEYRRDANGQVILNQLYKYTQLQDTCAVNMIALVNGEPKLLGLIEILSEYIKFQEEVIRRRTQFDLDKANARVHILEGQTKALDNIEEVIKTIRASNSVAEARDALVEKFDLTPVQAQAIVEMTLGKLSGLERFKIEEELKEKKALIEYLQGILADEGKTKEVIKEELLAIKEKYADARRTELSVDVTDIIDEDLIDRHECVITLTEGGYIKNMPLAEYSAQRRGGVGVIGLKTKEEDNVKEMILAHSHSYLLLFTNKGRVYAIKTYRIPESSRTSKGTAMANVINLMEGETVTNIISVPKFEENHYFMFVTKKGIVKRTKVTAFAQVRKNGIYATVLDEGDEVFSVMHTQGSDEFLIATRKGRMVKFHESQVRIRGRKTRGVRGIKLQSDDYVVGACVADYSKNIIVVTENGIGKRMDFSKFSLHNRSTQGQIYYKANDRTGYVAKMAEVGENDDIIIVTNEGTVIRTHVNQISVVSPHARGVIVMKLKNDEKVVNFTTVMSEEEERAELEAALKEEEKEENEQELIVNEEIGEEDDSEDTSN